MRWMRMQGWLHILIEVAVVAAAIAVSAAVTAHTLKRNYQQFVETLAKAMDARDTYTAGHSTRVADYAYGTARALGMSKRTARVIRDAAELHDIGKIGIPDAVLQKRGPLTMEDVGLIRLHPVIGRKILEKAGHCKELLPVVELHHENWDGSGYPYGLRGEEIPLEARIARVADAFDAMTSQRCYRDTRSTDWAIGELRRYSGSHFDPRVVGVFLTLLEHGVFETTLQSASSEPASSEQWMGNTWHAASLGNLAQEIAAANRTFQHRQVER